MPNLGCEEWYVPRYRDLGVTWLRVKVRARRRAKPQRPRAREASSWSSLLAPDGRRGWEGRWSWFLESESVMGGEAAAGSETVKAGEAAAGSELVREKLSSCAFFLRLLVAPSCCAFVLRFLAYEVVAASSRCAFTLRLHPAHSSCAFMLRILAAPTCCAFVLRLRTAPSCDA